MGDHRHRLDRSVAWGDADAVATRARRPTDVMAAAVVLALVAGACSSGSSSSNGRVDGHDHDRPRPPARPTALRPLHATRGTNARILDDQGRQVLLRGVNVNSLGDYFQANPQYTTTVAVTDADWATMAAHGFDVVRLLVSWSRLEPTKGHLDPAYLAKIQAAVDAAARHGIYSVIDMHQDAWGKYVASPPGVVCPSGAQTRHRLGRRAPVGHHHRRGRHLRPGRGARAGAGGHARLRPLLRRHRRDPDRVGQDVGGGGQGLRRRPGGGRLRPVQRTQLGFGRWPRRAPSWAPSTSGPSPPSARAEQAAHGPSHIVFFEPVVVFPSAGTLPPATDVSRPEPGVRPAQLPRLDRSGHGRGRASPRTWPRPSPTAPPCGSASSAGSAPTPRPPPA